MTIDGTTIDAATVDVADEHQAAFVRQGSEETVHQRQVDHRDLVEEVARERAEITSWRLSVGENRRMGKGHPVPGTCHRGGGASSAVPRTGMAARTSPFKARWRVMQSIGTVSAGNKATWT